MNLKGIVILILLVSIGDYSMAQSSNQYIIAPLTIVHNGNSDINLVSSESLNNTAYSNDEVITQGFLQPENFLYLTVEEQDNTFFRFYPNPVNDGIYIEFKNECGPKLELSLLNYLGQQVKSEAIDIDFKHRLYFPLNDLTPGVYLVRISDLEYNRASSLKLIKQ